MCKAFDFYFTSGAAVGVKDLQSTQRIWQSESAGNAIVKSLTRHVTSIRWVISFVTVSFVRMSHLYWNIWQYGAQTRVTVLESGAVLISLAFLASVLGSLSHDE